MALETINTYRPDYDPESRQYKDYNPIPAYTKGHRYRCLCSHSTTIFTKASDFTQHFKNKTHRIYILNYESNVKDLTDANDRILELQKNLERKHNEVLRLKRELDAHKEMIAKMIREDCPITYDLLGLDA